MLLHTYIHTPRREATISLEDVVGAAARERCHEGLVRAQVGVDVPLGAAADDVVYELFECAAVFGD